MIPSFDVLLKEKRTKALCAALFGISLLLCAAAAWLVPDFESPYSTVMYSAEGDLLGASVASDGQWRFPPREELPENFAAALVTFEDKRFYIHRGVDPAAIARALVQNVRGGAVLSGGSTITMQTARILLGNRPRTIPQKMTEACLAFILELTHTKKEILALYAAHAPFGGNIVGIEAASWRYFGRDPSNLTWAEAALLAVLPNQPSLVHPGGDRTALTIKRDRLLARLSAEGKFDESTLTLAVAEPLPQTVRSLPRLAPHYFERVKNDGPVIHTSIQSAMQRQVTDKLTAWRHTFNSWGIQNAAVFVVDTQTSSILAYAGNIGPGAQSGDVDVIQARRSSGSLLKPFLYGGMLDAGLLLPGQLVTDIPTRMGSYRPENNVPVYMGAVPADEALSKSLNVPAILELKEYGVEPFLRLLNRAGFTTFWRSAADYGLPLVLGGGEITLEEVTGAYAALMRNAGSSGGKENFPVSRGASWLTLNALLKGARPADEAYWQNYSSAKRIAWKTGTSYGSRDCWAVGVTSAYTVGVWVGNATGEGRPELRSIATSAPLLFDIFSLLETGPWPEQPADLESETVCASSGYLAGQYCAGTSEAFHPAGALPASVCPYCRAVSVTPDGKYRASVQEMTGEYGGMLPVTENRFVLPPALEAYYTKNNMTYRALPPRMPGANAGTDDAMAILFPQRGSQLYIPIEIDGRPGSIIAELFHRSPETIVFWDIDGEYIGQTRHIHQLELRPDPGAHTLTVTDTLGGQTSVTFEILGG